MDSFDNQFADVVRRWQRSTPAFLCDGDTHSAVIWDPQSQITIRLQLTEDEVWIIAGSGMLLRFVSASDGEFDHEGIDHVIRQILSGEAIEYFGSSKHHRSDVFVTGYRVGNGSVVFSGGLSQNQSRFHARIAGPMAVNGFNYLN